jgi:hypothetical protein
MSVVSEGTPNSWERAGPTAAFRVVPNQSVYAGTKMAVRA